MVDKEYTFNPWDARYVQSADDVFGERSYKVAFWNNEHGLVVNNYVKVELQDAAESSGSLVHKIEGRVTGVAEHEVSIWGSDVYDIGLGDENAS